MKTLQELAKKHLAEYTSSQDGGTDFYYVMNLADLESLINKVISQRLGEPVATVKYTELGTRILGGNNLQAGTKLYALNIES